METNVGTFLKSFLEQKIFHA